MESLRNRWFGWARTRLPLDGAAGVLEHKTVPLHRHSLWYYLGGMILVALATLILTGVMLVVYYQPQAPADPRLPSAHESLARIVRDLPHGWWIRSLHHWAAHLMIVTLIVHFMSTLMLKAYRQPREVIWWTGLVLLGLTLAAGFTGYLLPWNGLSFAATRVGTGIAAATPLAGSLIRGLLLGGPDVSELTLTRFFGIHVAVLPGLILAVVGLHLVLVVHHGSSVPPSCEATDAAGGAPPTLRFWPEFMLREVRLWLLVLAALLVVAYCLPPRLGLRADPLAATPEGIKPEWYFLAFYKVLKLLPTRILGVENLQVGLLGMGGIAALLMALPLLDAPAGAMGPARRRRLWRQRILLAAAFSLAWAATIPPVLAVSDGTPPVVAIAVAGAFWGAVFLLIGRGIGRRPGLAATMLGTVFVSVFAGYTIWEGLGGPAGTGALALLWLGLLVAWRAGARNRTTGPARVAGACLVLAAILSVIPLGRSTEAAHDVAGAPSAGAAVPEWRNDSRGEFAAALLVLASLLCVIELQVRHHRRLRNMGLFG